MWICTKNNQLINIDKVKCFTILKGKDYYDDNSVLTSYYYICADGNKIIKIANHEDALTEFQNIKSAIGNVSVYTANGIVITEHEQNGIVE